MYDGRLADAERAVLRALADADDGLTAGQLRDRVGGSPVAVADRLCEQGLVFTPLPDEYHLTNDGLRVVLAE